MSTEQDLNLLADWEITASGEPAGPAHRAASALHDLGAKVRCHAAEQERLQTGQTETTIGGWHAQLGQIAAEYLGLRAATAFLRRNSYVDVEPLLPELTEGMVADKAPAELVRCRNGWLVARWRNASEPVLLSARLGNPLVATHVMDAWTAARECRLLVSPVLCRPRVRTARLHVLRPAAGHHHLGSPLRVVDWTALWAGPWATGELARDGAQVVRVEAPERRDGLLRTRDGRSCWERWNGHKQLMLVNALNPSDRLRLEHAIAAADVLVDGHTPRVLPQLGFGPQWFAARAPHLARFSLVAYEEPYGSLPGLGEHGAAVTGLLWRGEDNPPARPQPWADPLFAASLLLALQAWQIAGRPIGLHLRLSLEGTAAQVLGAAQANPHMAALAPEVCPRFMVTSQTKPHIREGKRHARTAACIR